MSAPIVSTASSLNRIKSSPITASAATDRPPSVCSEPSVVLVAAVVSSVFIIPLAVTLPVTATAPLAIFTTSLDECPA